MDEKWIKVFLFGLFFFVIFIMLPKRERILVCSFAFLLPLELNKFIIRNPLNRVQGIDGLAIWGFDIVFIPLIFLWLYRLTINCTIRINFIPNVTIPFFFILTLSISGLFSVNAPMFMKCSVILEMFKCWFILIYAANNIDKKKIYLIIGVLLLTGLFQACVGIGQYVTNGPLGLGILGETSALKGGQAGLSRVGGTIGQPNKFALFLGTLVQISLSCFFAEFSKSAEFKKTSHLRWIYTISFAPMLFALFISYSRSGWFSFLLGGAVNCSWCMARRTGKKVFSIIVVCVFFTCFAFIVFAVSESVRNRILMDDKGASEVRKPLAQVAWNVIDANPWLGIGLNNYTTCYPKYDNTAYWVSVEFPAVVHNTFLLIAAELGIPAFICFIYILMYILFALWRISCTDTDSVLPYIAIGWFSGFISWIMHGQKEYEYIFFISRFWFNAGVILAIYSLVTIKE